MLDCRWVFAISLFKYSAWERPLLILSVSSPASFKPSMKSLKASFNHSPLYFIPGGTSTVLPSASFAINLYLPFSKARRSEFLI